MTESVKRSWKLGIAGFVTGLVTMLGVGGGPVATLTLQRLLGYRLKKALNVSLAAILPGVGVAFLTQYVLDPGDFLVEIFAWTALGSVPATMLGARWGSGIGDVSLKRVFAGLLMLIAFSMSGFFELPFREVPSDFWGFAAFFGGIIAGLGSSLFSFGGGAVLIPVYTLFLGLPLRAAISTSLGVVFLTALAGVIFHQKFKNIRLEEVWPVIPAALLGAPLGAYASHCCIAAGPLKTAFWIFLVVAAFLVLLERPKEEPRIE